MKLRYKILFVLFFIFYFVFLFIGNSFCSYNKDIPQDVIDLIPSLDNYNSSYGVMIFDYGLYKNCYRVCFLTEENIVDISGGSFDKKFVYIATGFYCIDIMKDNLAIDNQGFVSGNYHDSCLNSNFYFGRNLVVYDGGDIIYNSSKYEITLSTNEMTNGPIIAYSNYFNYEDALRYEVYISTDGYSWEIMNAETFNDTINNKVFFRFNYKIFKNGCYYFKFIDKSGENEDYATSYNITNILKNSSNSGFTDSGIPQPFCTYERVNDLFIIRTQNFTLEDILKLKCFYCNDNTYSSDFSTWNEMSMGTFNNTILGTVEYYFFFTVPVDSEDCCYYMVFYNESLKEYGYPSSMNCFFDNMREYTGVVSGVVQEKEDKFTQLLNFFKERFGFLTYPFEFISNFINRCIALDFNEPILHIPEMYEPFFNNKIFSGVDYNFNSLLNNTTFAYVHSIYLVAVDAILIIGFIKLCLNTLMEVTN